MRRALLSFSFVKQYINTAFNNNYLSKKTLAYTDLKETRIQTKLTIIKLFSCILILNAFQIISVKPMLINAALLAAISYFHKT